MSPGPPQAGALCVAGARAGRWRDDSDHRIADAKRNTLARWVSIVFHPVCQVYAVLLVVGAHAVGWRGFWLGLLAATFIGGVPGLVVWGAVRRGRVPDMDASTRNQRPLILGLSLISLIVGVGALLLLGTPRVLLVVLAAMVAGVVIAALVSMLWKVSVHAACITGTATVFGLTLGLGLPLLLTVCAAPLVLWSRVRTGSHDVAQVGVGALLGVLIPTAVNHTGFFGGL